ncbi:MAG: protein kinase [Acidobacteria bacterium]|nr:protein kinase [Acidobacteriota bacterium]
MPGSAKPAGTVAESYYRLLQNADPDNLSAAIPRLKRFIRQHPEFTLRGIRQIISFYVYAGKAEEGKLFFMSLPDSALPEKTIALNQLENLGYSLPEKEKSEFLDRVESACKNWNEIDMAHLLMMDLLSENERKLPPRLKKLPKNREAALFLKIEKKLENLKLTGIHKLLDAYPKKSDYLILLVENFPNTNGKMDRQLPEMIFLANAAKKAGNPEAALYVESQILALEVNYLGESRLDKEKYDQYVEECEKYKFFDTAIDIISTRSIHRIFHFDYEKALFFARKARKLSLKYHLRTQAGIYAGYMGICYSNLAQFDKAVDSYRIACDTLKEPEPGWYWVWKAKLAYSYGAIGDTDTALKIYLEILKRELKNNQPLQLQYTYRNLAELYIKRGELDKAESYLKKVNATSFPALIKKNEAIFGRLAYARGNYKKAVTYLNRCLKNSAPMDAPTLLDVMIDLAGAYNALGKKQMAGKAYRKASDFFEAMARKRFSNLTYRKGFFRQHHQLYLHYISFLVNECHKPGKAWLLVRHIERGPFQYFSNILKNYLRSLLSFPADCFPVYQLNKTAKNIALKKLLVRITDAATDGRQTILAGPGGVFQSDGIFYTRLSPVAGIRHLTARKGHWAGISRKELFLDGKILSLPLPPDRILNCVRFRGKNLLLGSSTGLYIHTRAGINRILDKPVIGLEIADGIIYAAVAGEGIFRVIQVSGTGKWEYRKLYPGLPELKNVVSFSKTSTNHFVVFCPDLILTLDKSGITAKIPFPCGIIQKAVALGKKKWMLTTLLKRNFIFENKNIFRINMGKSHLSNACSAGPVTFFSTDHAILVETTVPMIQIPILKKNGHKHPVSVIRIGPDKFAVGFRGKGISVFNMKTRTFGKLFRTKLEKFAINGSGLAVLTSSGHVKTWTGTIPGHLHPVKTFYPSSPVQTITQLPTGTVLASFSGGGLVQWQQDRPPRFFGHHHGLPAGETIFAIGQFNRTLYLGSNGEIIPFDYKRAGKRITIPGKVNCFVPFTGLMAAGTENGAFFLTKTGAAPIFRGHTTGKVFALDAAGPSLAAATENGVFVKTKENIFHIYSIEQPHFVAINKDKLLMVSDSSVFILETSALPALVQLGRNHDFVRIGNHSVFLRKDAGSGLFLDTGSGKMTPVTILKNRKFEIPISDLNEISAKFLTPFGGQPRYTGKPEILEKGAIVSPTSLKAGIHRLTLAGIAPMETGTIEFTAKLTRKISPAWWISALLGIIIALILALRYFKWKKGRYIAHYKILEQLGEGGMGTVFHAKDIRNNRNVALKLLNRNVDPVMIERFKREWQILDKIKHPNIIEVYDRGEHMDRFFIAMEMLHGYTLDEILDKNGPLPEQAVAAAAVAVTGALEIIHKKMVIHRDLKPSNIMYIHHREKISGKIRPEEIKLMDFGVSKELLREGLTTDGSLVGTLLYVAPESLSSLAVDRRSDIYALGVTMYELLTGTPPFTDENQISVYYKILNSPPPPFPENLAISLEMKTIVLKCLEKNPEKRYQNARELRKALSGLI